MKRILDEDEYQELKDKSDQCEYINSLCIEYSQLRFPANDTYSVRERAWELVSKICTEFGIQ